MAARHLSSCVCACKESKAARSTDSLTERPLQGCSTASTLLHALRITVLLQHSRMSISGRRGQAPRRLLPAEQDHCTTATPRAHVLGSLHQAHIFLEDEPGTLAQPRAPQREERTCQGNTHGLHAVA